MFESAKQKLGCDTDRYHVVPGDHDFEVKIRRRPYSKELGNKLLLGFGDRIEEFRMEKETEPDRVECN